MNGESRNLMIAIVLSVAILFVFNFFFAPEPDPALQQAQTQQTGSDVPTPGSGVAAPGGMLPAPSAPVIRAQAKIGTQRVTIDTPRVSGSIALTGAILDDVVLKDYTETIDDGSDNIHLLNPSTLQNAYYAEFGWVPMLQGVKVPTLETEWSASGDTLTPTNPVILSWDNGEGLVFKRTITIDTNYMFTISQSVENSTSDSVELYPYGLVSRRGTPVTSGFYILHEGPLGVINDTLEEVDYDDIKDAGEVKYDSTGGWIGVTDKYWLAALAPAQNEAATMRIHHQIKDNADKYQTDYLGTKRTVEPGAAVGYTSHFYAGAKEVNLLEGYEADLGITNFDLAIDFGWFYFLTKPFFHALQYINHMFGNYGIAILLLTVAVKLAFFPLANKSYKAMSRMKQLQPEMLRIRDQFADDKMRQQQEMMALYKREKVNPASGCLPILVQIPVFFALYKVLFVSIEMRQAPFFGWIQDLSAPDPTTIFNAFGLIPWDPPQMLMIGVWPLIMGGTMFLQQKLNPPPTDPMQQKIMAFLPLVFTIMLAAFPAGLVIYWAWNNLLSIAQQKYIMWKMGVK